MKMNRIVCIALLLVFIVPGMVFAAGAREEREEHLIGFVVKALDQEFWFAVRDGAMAADEDFTDVRVMLDGAAAETLVEEQIALVEDMIVRGASALVIAPTAPVQLIPVMERAIADGIPVLLVDTDVDDWEAKTTFIGTDNRTAASVAGKFMAENLSDGSRIAILEGIPGVATSEHRVEGFKEGLASVGKDIEIVASLTARWDRAEGVTVMEDIITRHGAIDAVFAANDQMALGAIEAIRGAGISFDDIMVVGFDGTPGAAQAILNGEMTASVAQMPFMMGYMGVEAAREVILGREIDRVIDTGADLVTKENAESYL